MARASPELAALSLTFVLAACSNQQDTCHLYCADGCQTIQPAECRAAACENVFAFLAPRLPVALTTDSTSVYWADTSGSFMKGPLSGGRPTTLASSYPTPGGIALGGGNLFWTESVLSVSGSPLNSRNVMEVPIDGGLPMTLAPSAGSWGIAANAASVTWVELGLQQPVGVDGGPAGWGSGIVTMRLDGGRPSQLASSMLPGPAIAIDGVNAYWSTDEGALMRTPLQGGPSGQLASGPGPATAIAVDTTQVYWTARGTTSNGADGSVLRAPLGGGKTITLAHGQGAPVGIAVDSRNVYWINGGTNGPNCYTDSALVSVPLAGGTATTLYAGKGAALLTAIANGPGAIYVAAMDVGQTNGKILRVAPQ
jgi:hypothetical protein